MRKEHDPVTYRGWTAPETTSVETLDAAPVAALGALLDSGAPVPGAGEALPPLWHWVALPRWPVSSAIGPDGHPRRGETLPPVDLPRRMFAGGEVTLHGDLRVGARVVRQARVDSIQEKVGRSGALVIVRVGIRLRGLDGDLLLEERQDLVYREATPAPAPSDLPDPAVPATAEPVGAPLLPDRAGWCFRTDPTLLMRFSAATANPHRIHYDWPYATHIEGYPGLVVHGPLSTLVLAECLRLEHPERSVRQLVHRNTAPLFCGENARVKVALPSRDTAEVRLSKGDDRMVAGLSADLTPDTSKGTRP
ncbi:FAS1-like dehydratase domain-containing protein [Amycolatopsis taiwanensis]|uniref:Acyl-CoA dehydrogenase n=1 Tax=Amycolatopsis taiwanensis TaxID=342230 RepID=A0A9W6R298_9PSEU|nr:MaoC family dehydratase N-terminal domain-containing protein [Amycolatopsis taiwanensis]GLY67968.1 acyl-CoA dehydrogenase [Amycolatopsis taiwanensis]